MSGLAHERKETVCDRALNEGRAERPERNEGNEKAGDSERRQGGGELAFDDQVKQKGENGFRESCADSDRYQEHDSENDCAHAVSIGSDARKSSPPASGIFRNRA